ncbi:MAG TPA: extracellular solute-binding protein [Aggregatilineales bacterium]|nr:extracellular solute-binding protein [Aggregatilineales bacterium]
MKFTNRFVLTICVLAMTFAGVSAGNAQSSIPSVLKMPAQIAGGRPVTISMPDKPPSSDASSLKVWTDQVGRFTKAYPNVTINGLEYSYATDTFAALVAGKQVPTLFRVYMTDPQIYINLGIAADITKIVDANNLRQIVNPNILNLGIKDNKVYAFPKAAYAMGLGYNLTLLKAAGISAPPATWDELRADAKKLTDRSKGISGFSFINDGTTAAGWHLTIISYTYGAKPTDLITPAANGKYTAGFGTGAPVDTLNFIKQLRWTDDVLPHDTVDWPTNGTLLGTGKAAMVMMAGSQYEWIKTQLKDVDMTTLGFAPLPSGPGGVVSLIGGDTYMVSSAASADEQEAATYFALWSQLDPDEHVLNMNSQKASGNPVGGPDLPLFVGSYEAARETFDKPFYTLPYDNYSSFLNAVTSGKVKLQVEPTPAGQDYYAAVATVLTSVLTDQTVDPAKALADAAKTFQATTLDHLGQPPATAAATAAK